MTYDDKKPGGQEKSSSELAANAKGSAKQASHEAKNSAKQFSEEAKTSAKEASESVKQQAKHKVEENRDLAASELDKVAHAAEAAAEDLERQHQEGLSTYISDIAHGVSSMADSMRHKSVDELVHDVEGLARKNPALFIAGSIAIGLGMSRFAKASSKREPAEMSTDHGYTYRAEQAKTESQYPATASDLGTSNTLHNNTAFPASSLSKTTNNGSTLGDQRYD